MIAYVLVHYLDCWLNGIHPKAVKMDKNGQEQLTTNIVIRNTFIYFMLKL